MLRTLRPVVVLILGLLVAACGGGGPSLPGSSPAPLPGPPRMLDFETTPLNEVLLTWAAPDPEPGRAPVTGYEVYLEGEARPVGVTGSLSYLYQGLVPGRTYVFHVRAVNRVGRSQPAGSVTVTVIAVVILAPEPPGSLTAELTPNDGAFLRWGAPAPAPGRAPVTGYVIYRELSGGGVEELGVTDSLSYLHPALSAGERYVFTVRASSDAGLSDASPSAAIDVPPPASELAPPEPPGSLTAELTPNDEAFLRWEAPAPAPGRAPVTGYVIHRELPGGDYEELGETESLSYVHPNLAPGESYVFTVRASSDAGLSDASASAFVDVPPTVVLLPPAPPGSLTAELTPNSEALLQWTPPTPAPDRAPVTGYVIYLELPNGADERLGTTESLSFTYAEQLSPGERYVFSVRASSTAGPSDASASAFVDVPPTVVLLPPAPPGSLTAELTPNSEALLQWTPPTPSPDRAPVTGYVVYLELPNGALRATRHNRIVVVYLRRTTVSGRALRFLRAGIEHCRAFRCLSVGVRRCSAGAGSGTQSPRQFGRRADVGP